MMPPLEEMMKNMNKDKKKMKKEKMKPFMELFEYMKGKNSMGKWTQMPSEFVSE